MLMPGRTITYTPVQTDELLSIQRQLALETPSPGPSSNTTSHLYTQMVRSNPITKAAVPFLPLLLLLAMVAS